MSTKLRLRALGAFLIACALAPVLPAQPRTYYVDGGNPAASDANPGTSAQPFKTIARGVDAAFAGDTVFLRGVYHEQLVTEREGNTADGNIIFTSWPGQRAVIDGDGVTTGNNGVIVRHSYVSVGMIEVRNWNDVGIWVTGAGWALVCSCEVHQVGGGVAFSDGAHDFILCSTVAHHFDLFGFDASPGGGAPCFNGLFRGSTAHTGRDTTQNVDGFALGHGAQHGMTIENCLVWDTYDGFDISAAGTLLNRCSARGCWNSGYKIWEDGVRLVNCVSAHHQGACVELDWNGRPGPVTLFNCTLYDAGTYSVQVYNSGDSLRMYNCIMAGGDNIGIRFEQGDASSYRGDYNLYHNDNPDRMISVGSDVEFGVDSLAAWRLYSGQDEHSLVVPSVAGLFVNAATFDLRVASGSPAIDAGLAAGSPAIDFDGNPRPRGGGVDIGAYEFQGATHARGLPAPAFPRLDLFPNPSSGRVTIEASGDPGGAFSIVVTDMLGRVVRADERVFHADGRAIMRWDGRDSGGIPVPSGVYLLTAKSGRMHEGRIVFISR